METDLIPLPEFQERSRKFADAVLALKAKIEALGMILDNVMEHATDLGNEMDALTGQFEVFDLTGVERADLVEFDHLADAEDQRMTEEGQDEVVVVIDDPQKRDAQLRRVLNTMIDPLARQFAGTRIDDSIADARSTRSRLAEVLTKAGVPGKSREKEMVRRLMTRYKFSG